MGLKIRDLFIQIGIEADEDALKRIDKGVDQIKTSANLTAFAIKSLTIAIGGMTLASGLFLKQAGDFEQATVAFETMLGSAEKAKTLLKDVQEFAAKTPFQFVELVELSKRTLAFGFSMKQVIPLLSDLGNIAAGVGRDKLPRLLLALGQVRAAGKLRGQEVRQFTEAGVPLIEQLSKVLMVPQKEIQGLISAGKVSFEDTREALRRLSGPGGRFFNLMIKQSKTLLGALSNTIDILQIFAVEIGTEMLPAAKQILIEFLKFLEVNRKMLKLKIVGFFQSFGKFMLIVFRVTKALFTAVIDLGEAFGGLERILKAVIFAFGLLIGFQTLAAIGNITLGIWNMVKAMRALRVMTMLTNAALAFWPILIGIAVIALAALIEDIVSFFQGKDSITGLLVEEFKNLKPILLDIIGGTIEEMRLMFVRQWESFKNLPFFKFLANAGSGLGNFAAGITGSFNASPGSSPASSAPSTTSTVQVNSPISVSVPDGTPPELIGSSIHSGIADAFGGILRSTQRATEPVVEF